MNFLFVLRFTSPSTIAQSYTRNTSLNTSITKNRNKIGLTLPLTPCRRFGLKSTRDWNPLPPRTLYRYVLCLLSCHPNLAFLPHQGPVNDFDDCDTTDVRDTDAFELYLEQPVDRGCGPPLTWWHFQEQAG